MQEIIDFVTDLIDKYPAEAFLSVPGAMILVTLFLKVARWYILRVKNQKPQQPIKLFMPPAPEAVEPLPAPLFDAFRDLEDAIRPRIPAPVLEALQNLESEVRKALSTPGKPA